MALAKGTGTVKFFRGDKGYGFITSENGNNEEYFFHISNIKDVVDKGDVVVFEIIETRKGKQAINVSKKKN